jgi:hypothetical protein
MGSFPTPLCLSPAFPHDRLWTLQCSSFSNARVSAALDERRRRARHFFARRIFIDGPSGRCAVGCESNILRAGVPSSSTDEAEPEKARESHTSTAQCIHPLPLFLHQEPACL